MKNRICIITIKCFFISFLLMMWASCDDYLDLTPPSEVVSENYLWDEDHLAAYTIKYYADYENGDYGAKFEEKGGMFGSHSGGSGQSPYNDDLSTDNEITQGNNNSRYVPGKGWTVGQNGGYWNFRNIRPLNYYLETVVPRYEAGQITGSATNIRHYIGEGYFLRAQEYFFRLRRVGDFPILTKTYSDNDAEGMILASRRSPRNEVARFILQDLDEAVEFLSNSIGGKNRITKDAALLLKSRVALFEATWLKYHAGTALVPGGPGWPGKEKSYNADYTYPTGSIDKEIEFFLKEALEAAEQVADAVALTENNGVNQQSTEEPKNPYYDMFATLNPSGYSEVIMYRSYNETLGVQHWVNHYMYGGGAKGYTKQFEKAFLMENGLPWYAAGSEYEGDDYIEDTKIKRDNRWRLFMKAPNENKAIFNIDKVEKFDNAPVIYMTDKASTSTGYIKGKGYSLDYNMQVGGKDLTACVIFRASEAYLNYIEASYLLKGSIDAKADKYWKQLRKRAGVNENYQATITATDMATEAENDWGAYSANKIVDATLYNIRRERRCELMGEGMRYMDLIRWRAMDQLAANPAHLEGCKIWGPLQNRYRKNLLIHDNASELRNNVSSPSLSEYLRPNEIRKTENLYYNGLSFCEAHYLDPIAVDHFLISSPDGKTVSESPIYQNPGWPVQAGASPIGY